LVKKAYIVLPVKGEAEEDLAWLVAGKKAKEEEGEADDGGS
jgi:hypothetical protein